MAGRRGFKVRSEGAVSESPVLNQAAAAHVTLINITREQVQVRGGGSDQLGPFEFLMNAGCITKPGTSGKRFRDSRNCILHVKRNVALKMAKRRKAFLRILPIKEGRALEVRAKGYVAKYGSEAFYRALGELYPRWVVRNDVDEAREARERKRLIAQFQQLIGEPPDESWSNARILAATKDVAGAFADGSSAANSDDIFSIFGAPVDGVNDGIVEDESPFAGDDDEDDEEEAENVLAPARVAATDPAKEEKLAVMKQLTLMGVKHHHLNSIQTLNKLLANAIAARASASS